MAEYVQLLKVSNYQPKRHLHCVQIALVQEDPLGRESATSKSSDIVLCEDLPRVYEMR